MTSKMVLGVAPFELLAPRAKGITDSFADAILERMKSQGATPLRNGLDAQGHIEELARNGVRSVEIYGLWENKCVFAAVKDALANGMNVQVPKGYTMSGPDTKETLAEKVGEYKLPVRISQDDEFMYLTPRRKVLGIF